MTDMAHILGKTQCIVGVNKYMEEKKEIRDMIFEKQIKKVFK